MKRINSLRPIEAYMHQQATPSLAQVLVPIHRQAIIRTNAGLLLIES